MCLFAGTAYGRQDNISCKKENENAWECASYFFNGYSLNGSQLRDIHNYLYSFAFSACEKKMIKRHGGSLCIKFEKSWGPVFLLLIIGILLFC